MKVRRIHGEINPSHRHVPELLQKSMFLATKIQAEFTGPHRTNYDISISQERIALMGRVFSDKNEHKR